jgi:AcrB/AcrD/AcrF family
MGDQQFIVKVNTLAPSIDDLNKLPVKQVGGATVYLSDIAHVRDAWAVQQNIVRSEGRRSVLLTIIKNGDASTLDVVNRVKAALPEIRKAAPPGMNIDLLFEARSRAGRRHRASRSRPSRPRSWRCGQRCRASRRRRCFRPWRALDTVPVNIQSHRDCRRA